MFIRVRLGFKTSGLFSGIFLQVWFSELCWGVALHFDAKIPNCVFVNGNVLCGHSNHGTHGTHGKRMQEDDY